MAELKWYELPPSRWQELSSAGFDSYRDSQRQKMYDAEYHLRRNFEKENTKFESIAEIDLYVHKLIKSAWFSCRWGKQDVITIIEILGRTAWGSAEQRKMALPKWAWNKVIVLHELSHVIHPYGSGTTHGRFFCRTLLELIDHELGPEARRCLKKRFVVTGVRSTPHPVYTIGTLIKKKEHGKKLAAEFWKDKNKPDISEWNKMLALTGVVR